MSVFSCHFLGAATHALLLGHAFVVGPATCHLYDATLSSHMHASCMLVCVQVLSKAVDPEVWALQQHRRWRIWQASIMVCVECVTTLWCLAAGRTNVLLGRLCGVVHRVVPARCTHCCCLFLLCVPDACCLCVFALRHGVQVLAGIGWLTRTIFSCQLHEAAMQALLLGHAFALAG
jgi:hypothetical protein